LRRRSRLLPDSLRQLIPDEHVLARINCVLDLDDGRPGIDPEVAVSAYSHSRKIRAVIDAEEA
jgi:hypothetical protein